LLFGFILFYLGYLFGQTQAQQ